MLMNKLKLNPHKTEFLLIRNERQWSKYLSMFPVQLFGVKTCPGKFPWNLRVIFDKNITFHSHISCLYVARAFTISRICGIFAITLIWIVQNYLQLLLCLVVLIIAIHFRMVLQTPTFPNFNVFRTVWPALWQSHFTFTGGVPLLRSLHWLPVNFRILFKINLLTYKTLHE